MKRIPLRPALALAALTLTALGGGVRLARAHTRISTDLTWSADIRPIFREKCMSCHSPGGIAPSYVNLTTYGGKPGQTGARDWAKAIEEEIQSGRMPPWQPDDRYGDFGNKRALTRQERDYILWWAGGGAPQGAPRDMPTPEEFVNRDWTLGQPDLIVESAEDVVVPAGEAARAVAFSQKLPDTLGADAKGAPTTKTWLTGYEFLPGGAEAVHSIAAWIRDPEGAPDDAVDIEIKKPYDPLADEKDREQIKPRTLPAGRRFLGRWTRGDAPVFLPDESGKRLRGGSTVEVEVVFRKHGPEDLQKEFRIRPKLGLFFAKGPIEFIVETAAIEGEAFTVKAGEAGVERRASTTFAENVHLAALYPNLGAGAASVEFTLTYPDERARTLALIPAFSPKWLSALVFREPVRAPAGSRLEMIAHYDNTKANPNLRDRRQLGDILVDNAGDAVAAERMAALADVTLDNEIYIPKPALTPAPTPVVSASSGMLFVADAAEGAQADAAEGAIQLNNLGGALAPEIEAQGSTAINAAPAHKDESAAGKSDSKSDRKSGSKSGAKADAKSEAKPEATGGKTAKVVADADTDKPAFWCPMRCEKKDYPEPGKCPVCKMDLKPKKEVMEQRLKAAKGLVAAKEYAWPLKPEARAEVYWCPNRGQAGHELKDYAAPGKCEVCGEALMHKARFKPTKTWMCLTEECASAYAKDKAHNLFYSPGLCPDCGEPVEGMGHMDHNPVHGGKFFMADNMYHHLEGALEKPDEFHLYFYDDWKTPIDPRNFSGKVVFETYNEAKDDYERQEFPLEYPNAEAPFLQASFPAATKFPVEFTAKVWLAGEEKLYTFIFDELTQPPAPDGAGAAGAGAGGVIAHKHDACPKYATPAEPDAVAAGIYAKAAALRALIDKGDVLNLHCDAFDVMDSVDAVMNALRARKIDLPAPRLKALRGALDQIRQGAYFLHEYGHSGDAARVENKAWKQFAAGVEALRKIYPEKTATTASATATTAEKK